MEPAYDSCSVENFFGNPARATWLDEPTLTSAGGTAWRQSVLSPPEVQSTQRLQQETRPASCHDRHSSISAVSVSIRAALQPAQEAPPCPNPDELPCSCEEHWAFQPACITEISSRSMRPDKGAPRPGHQKLSMHLIQTSRIVERRLSMIARACETPAFSEGCTKDTHGHSEDLVGIRRATRRQKACSSGHILATEEETVFEVFENK